jgi:hypothetical protein
LANVAPQYQSFSSSGHTFPRRPELEIHDVQDGRWTLVCWADIRLRMVRARLPAASEYVVLLTFVYRCTSHPLAIDHAEHPQLECHLLQYTRTTHRTRRCPCHRHGCTGCTTSMTHARQRQKQISSVYATAFHKAHSASAASMGPDLEKQQRQVEIQWGSTIHTVQTIVGSHAARDRRCRCCTPLQSVSSRPFLSSTFSHIYLWV